MSFSSLVFFVLVFLVPYSLFSQHTSSDNEKIVCQEPGQGDEISEIRNPESGALLKFPWAGGLNSCQFCSLDLNLDGIKDLLIFDRHGNRKLTFINHGTPGTIDYNLAREFSGKIPDLHDWVITADYDCDGKMDIFTYGMGGIRVFRNVSDTSLKFSLVTDLLESFYYTGYIGVLVTSVDYPAIADIDGDGDLDLLTFFGLGSFVEYHKNMSIEKYGKCDSLDFRLADHCWGKFKESGEGNKITLIAGCPFEKYELRMTNDEWQSHRNLKFESEHLKIETRNSEIEDHKDRHTGSTLLATDLNNDGLKDLVIGDVDYPGLVALYNGGAIDSAVMVAQDTVFPSTSRPVDLFAFPVISLIDIDNDGKNDLLVSPFDPSFHTSDNYNCVWFYKNTGSNAQPHFELLSEKLLRDEMMDFGSASHPVLYDFDGDDLLDMIVGNEGYYDSSYYKDAVLHSVYTSQLAFFRNTGTNTSPVFKCLTDDLAGISAMGLHGAYPALGDLNGDGHPDLILGNSDGTIIFFKNSGNSSVIPDFEKPIRQWQGLDVGDYSTPMLFDLDKDNGQELIIGEQNGNLNYYKNFGTTENPQFSLVTDSLGKVNVTNFNVSYYGYSTPCFARRPDGVTFLVCGSEAGRIHFYENIDKNLDGKFTESGNLYTWLSATPSDTIFGRQTSPAVAHLTDLAEFDLITGNYSGGLNYISKRLPAQIIPGIEVSGLQPSKVLGLSPNPADQTVTIKICSEDNHSLLNGDNHFTGNSSNNIQIFNLFSQKLIDIPYSGTLTLSTTNLPNGIYLVRCGNSTGKLVVKHP